MSLTTTSNVKFDFTGETCLITGGTSGIGLATARMFGEAGGTVVVAGSTQEKADITAEMLTASGVKASGIGFDLSKPAAVERGCGIITAKYSGIRYVVHSPGRFRPKKFADETAADWGMYHDLNWGLFRVTQEVVNNMNGEPGAIVFISSGWVDFALDITDVAAYGAAKAAQEGLAVQLAGQLGPKGTRVNVIAPGAIDTPIHRGADLSGFKVLTSVNRVGTAEEVASVAGFLMGDGASYINGQIIGVDGGMGARRALQLV